MKPDYQRQSGIRKRCRLLTIEIVVDEDTAGFAEELENGLDYFRSSAAAARLVNKEVIEHSFEEAVAILNQRGID